LTSLRCPAALARLIALVAPAALLVGASLAPAAARAASRTVTLESLLHEMTDRDALARRPDPAYTLKQISSHDPAKRDPADEATWHSNHDYEQFVRTEVNEGRHEWVIMDEAGPGAIVRFWLPLNADRDRQVIRFYFDGSATPAIAAKFNDLMSGRALVPPPFAFVAWNDDDLRHQSRHAPGTLRGVAGDLYLPIPFARRCKITLDQMPFYYIADFRAYTPGTRVRTLAMADLDAAKAALTRAGDLLTEPPAAMPASAQSAQQTVAPGGKMTLDLPEGSRAVRDVEVRIDPKDAPRALRSLVVTAAFDGEPTVWCPAGDFFGTGARLHAVRDRFREVKEDGTLRASWTMPYRRAGSVTLRNVGAKPLAVRLAAATEPWRWDDRSLLFHSNWRCTLDMKTRPRADWNYIDLHGEGRYVGDTLTVYSPVPDWYGEGDERIYVDGETFPSHIGTGTEDYYGYAWGMASYFSSPFLSTPRRDLDDRGDWRGYTTTSRLRVLDSIPVTTALKVDMEVWHWADTRVDYAAATFWYGRPGATHNRTEQPAEAAAPIREAPPLPKVTKIDGAIEFEELPILRKSPGTETSTQNEGLHVGQWSNGRQLFTQASGIGDFVEFSIPVGDDKPRRLTLYGTKSYDYAIVRFLVNGKRAGADYDGYTADPAASGPIDLGTVTPEGGKLLLRVEVVGANAAARGKRTYFGLDCAVLQRP
jgi:hypothetical protein